MQPVEWMEFHDGLRKRLRALWKLNNHLFQQGVFYLWGFSGNYYAKGE